MFSLDPFWMPVTSSVTISHMFTSPKGLGFAWGACFALMYQYPTRSAAAVTFIDLTEHSDFLLIFLYINLLQLFDYYKRSFGLSFFLHIIGVQSLNWQNELVLCRIKALIIERTFFLILFLIKAQKFAQTCLSFPLHLWRKMHRFLESLQHNSKHLLFPHPLPSLF